MNPEFDLVVRRGTIADGSGGDLFEADVGVRGRHIVALGTLAGQGREEIDARNCLVTPGFIDLHTHYDGQVTWDSSLAPSSLHGVTTVLTGNCAVGFAPCRREDHARLISVMEGVEDIPGIVLAEGIPWSWETFPQFLDFLDERRTDIDFAVQIAHAPLRIYVMGERGFQREPATHGDIQSMARIVEEAIKSGALGFSTSRTLLHRMKDGTLAPTVTANEEELRAIALSLRRCGTGVLQMIDDFADTSSELSTEFDMWRRIVKECGRPMSFNLVQHSSYPNRWADLLKHVERANADGLQIAGQVIGRPVSMLFGLELSYHPFSMCPSYQPLVGLPLADKVRALRTPELRRRLLSELPESREPRMREIVRLVEHMFVLGDPPDYSPPAEMRLDARAAGLGIAPLELAYELLLEQDGRNLLFLPIANFEGGTLDSALVMMKHPHTLVGLGDGGAHCGLICDASASTYMLTYWTRDRRTERLPLPWAVRALSAIPAAHVGLLDRGQIAPGYLADLNVIDYQKLRLQAPRAVYDLPAGGRRLMQTAEGYVATIKSGTAIYRHGQDTGQRPGRLVRGARGSGIT